jgi:hypothetical protein
VLPFSLVYYLVLHLMLAFIFNNFIVFMLFIDTRALALVSLTPVTSVIASGWDA